MLVRRRHDMEPTPPPQQLARSPLSAARARRKKLLDVPERPDYQENDTVGPTKAIRRASLIETQDIIAA